MAGDGESTKALRLRKRVEADSDSSVLKRARDGSAFARCEECNKDVAAALISFHNCSLDAKIKMNLEAQVVEMLTEKKPVVKRKAKQTGTKSRKAKDPKAPKRPPTAFFVFMEDFRKTFKETNPGTKKGSVVAKEGGAKWKSMSVGEKEVYFDRAKELKAEYEKSLESNDADDEEEDVDDPSEKALESNDAENEDGVDDSPEKDLESNDVENEQGGGDSSEKKVDEETEVDDE